MQESWLIGHQTWYSVVLFLRVLLQMRRKELDIEYLRSRQKYDIESGNLIWLPKPELDWRDRAWNSANAGNVAGCKFEHSIRVRIDGVLYCAHRCVWAIVYGEWPTKQIDHINGDPTDNRLANLRLATASENMWNQRKRTDNTSGLKGVYLNEQGSYYSKIKKHNKSHHLGTFPTAEEAYSAYCRASAELHGAFGRKA
jgi:HNH endonuclease